MSATTPRRHHDFRRVTDVTTHRAADGDTLYRMPSHLIDNLCQAISIETNLAATAANRTK
jgi:hypothetical protein